MVSCWTSSCPEPLGATIQHDVGNGIHGRNQERHIEASITQ